MTQTNNQHNPESLHTEDILTTYEHAFIAVGAKVETLAKCIENAAEQLEQRSAVGDLIAAWFRR